MLSYLASLTSTFTAIPQHLPRSHNTIKLWVLNNFSQTRSLLQANLDSGLGAIHFSFDLCSSPNNLALLGVVGHWMSKEGHIHHTLLGLRKMEGSHTGENQFALLWKVIEEYGLKHRIGFFTFDNASNNDVALRVLATRLNDYGMYHFINLFI